jgi:ferredoxin
VKIALHPLNKTADVPPGTNLLETLLSNEVKVRSVCKGRGICATCQVKVRANPAALSPRTPQEAKTLGLIVAADAATRLACQCRVVGDGVVIELPQGVYVDSIEDLLELIGECAVADYLHPVNGAVLIPKDKVITRTQLQVFKTVAADVAKLAE